MKNSNPKRHRNTGSLIRDVVAAWVALSLVTIVTALIVLFLLSNSMPIDRAILISVFCASGLFFGLQLAGRRFGLFDSRNIAAQKTENHLEILKRRPQNDLPIGLSLITLIAVGLIVFPLVVFESRNNVNQYLSHFYTTTPLPTDLAPTTTSEPTLTSEPTASSTPTVEPTANLPLNATSSNSGGVVPFEPEIVAAATITPTQTPRPTVTNTPVPRLLSLTVENGGGEYTPARNFVPDTCDQAQDGAEGRQFRVTITVENVSDTTVTEWFARFRNSDGKPLLYYCYIVVDNLFTLSPAERRQTSVYAWVESGKDIQSLTLTRKDDFNQVSVNTVCFDKSGKITAC